MVGSDLLGERVLHEGRCWRALFTGDLPVLPDGVHGADQNTAAELCSDCAVQEQCLELSYRLTGHHGSDIWGPLSAEDRRDTFPIWRDRRARQWREGGRP